MKFDIKFDLKNMVPSYQINLYFALNKSLFNFLMHIHDNFNNKWFLET